MRIDVTIRDRDGTEHDAAIPAGACSGARTGAVVSGGLVVPPAPVVTGQYRLEVVGGPDAGRAIALGPGPARIGRHRDSTLVLADPDVSRRHAEVWVGTAGPQVRELGSANGSWIEGEPVTGRPVALAPGRYLRLGDTVLCVRRGTDRPALTRDAPDGAVLLNRPPVPAARAPEVEITLPAPPCEPAPQHLPWLAALIPAAAGAGLALAFHSIQFLLFTALSPVALLATALGDRWHRRRTRRKNLATHRQGTGEAVRRLAAALDAETTTRRARDPDPAAVLAIATLPGARLWARPGEDAVRLRVGLGRQEAHTRVRDGPVTRPAGTVELVPIVIGLSDGPIGIAAPAPIAAGIARCLVGQLCAHHPPAQLRLALLLSPASEPGWRWARWLPHLGGRVATAPGEHAALVAELARAAAQPGRLVLVVDRHGVLADTPGLPDLLAAGTTSALCVDEREAALPAVCTSVLAATGESGNRAVLRTGVTRCEVIADRVGPDWADRLARALAPLRDSGSRPDAAVPERCRLLPLLGEELDRDRCVTRWAADTGGLDTVLGLGAAGPCVVDLARDGPHALVAGTTGSGKSEVLRALVAGLAIRHSPDAVTFVLIDYKGGAAFAECARLPHTVGVVTDLDPHLARRALRSLTAELTRRERLLAAVAARDLEEYRAAGAAAPLPRLVIVVDEFAELAGELAEFVTGLVGIARRGRSLGVHLVLATQRPGGSISAEIRTNTALRICLRVSDPGESRDVIGTDDAAAITPRTPGRAYLQLAGGAPVPVQVAHLGGDPYAGVPSVPLDHWRRPAPAPAHADDSGGNDLPAVVAALRAAAMRAGIAEPHAPWLPPLPERVKAADLTGGTETQVPLGLLDLPTQQCRRALFADLSAPQSLLIAGAPRTGRTSALLTLAVGAAAQLPPDRLQLYAIDFAGGGLGALGMLPHTGSLVGPDATTAALLVRRLRTEAGRRREAPGPPPPVLLLLDGWEEFSAAVDELDAGGTTDALLELLRAGPSAGFSTAIAGGPGTFAPRLAGQVGVRLLLPLSDRNDAALAGVAPAQLPTRACPGRAVRVGDAAELQLAHLGAAPTEAEQQRAIARARTRWRDSPRATGAVRVRPLPPQVELDALPARAGRVLLGVGGDAAAPVAVDLFAGQARLLVAGPPRSGRSTVLRLLLLQLLALDVPMLVAAPARSPLTALAIERDVPVLRPGEQPPDRPAPRAVLVDDSAAFLDAAAGEALTTLVRDGPAGLAAVAAGDSSELAITFRGVGAEVRRSRCAVLLAPGPADGELAGVRLPRRRGDAPPGRGVLVGDPAWGPGFGAGPIPIQVALP
ncbi:FtsK/SpoIIIE domain-containing protein [Jatrophihabitans cynanchi]|uniref:FtsK/SpoIIIE domain-containing protein n=1 Tax=Jatrophihabitans cynanchi TaxID=2944128 RepID=A0ABY7JWX5_9ACTN|nr:FtsK/SpoIIIE domain-containing protein [Jatrophihabitans sp. SB3-54]WAX56143.1 FtsK/SpoIIIE domain-containing protein [Jatrophihabitans sp. SB3-54]